jgi:hypothetical protein
MPCPAVLLPSAGSPATVMTDSKANASPTAVDKAAAVTTLVQEHLPRELVGVVVEYSLSRFLSCAGPISAPCNAIALISGHIRDDQKTSLYGRLRLRIRLRTGDTPLKVSACLGLQNRPRSDGTQRPPQRCRTGSNDPPKDAPHRGDSKSFYPVQNGHFLREIRSFEGNVRLRRAYCARQKVSGAPYMGWSFRSAVLTAKHTRQCRYANAKDPASIALFPFAQDPF